MKQKCFNSNFLRPFRIQKMSRESLKAEPILDDEIVEQNEELMDEKFPEIMLTEWYSSVVPSINEVIQNYSTMSDKDIHQKTHKAAGSCLQLGGHQLGTALRTISHLVQAGNKEEAGKILEDIPLYLDSFENAIKATKN